MLVLSAGPGTLGVAPSFVVTREVAPGDLPADSTTRLEAFVEGQAEQMRDTLPAPLEVQGRRADYDMAEPVFRAMLNTFRLT